MLCVLSHFVFSYLKGRCYILLAIMLILRLRLVLGTVISCSYHILSQPDKVDVHGSCLAMTRLGFKE